MQVGRPTEYDADRVAKQTAQYVADCKQNYYLPTIEGLAVHLCVSRQTLYDWSDPQSDRYHEEFSDIFEQLRAAQASQLIQNGLKGEYNSTITKLMLTKHGYVERQDVTSGDKPIPPLLVRFLGDDETENNGNPEGVPKPL